ncbi:MAG: hypothetical protein RLY93_06220 [Sumerlaeia bacterium]
MGIVSSVIRFITTLGGLISTSVDEGSDALTTTPKGIKAAFKVTRDKWTKQYHEVRDAVSQLMMVMEQKRSEIVRLEKEQEELEIKKRGAVERFKATREPKYQQAFQAAHTRLGEVETRLDQLAQETQDLEKQVDRYKLKLQEMQKQISELDRKEAESIADIVSSKQIVELNDRMANLSTSLSDENIQAIEKTRQKAKARAKLSDELAGVDNVNVEQEILAAGMSTDAEKEFAEMLAETEMRERERPGGAGPELERSM